jgi:hypothetical protein
MVKWKKWNGVDMSHRATPWAEELLADDGLPRGAHYIMSGDTMVVLLKHGEHSVVYHTKVVASYHPILDEEG